MKKTMTYFPDNAEKSKIDSLLRKYGRNSMSSLLLYDGFQYHFLNGREGFIGYYDMPKLLIGIAEPICRKEDYGRCIAEFMELGGKAKKDCAFLLVEEHFAEIAKGFGFNAIQIGEDFIFDVQTYAPRGDNAKKVRSATNQVRKRGAIVQEYNPLLQRDRHIEEEFAAISRRWIQSRKFKCRAYFVGLKLFDLHSIKRYFYVEYDNRIVAFLTCLPIYEKEGYLFEDLVRDPLAPNGASELMILEAIKKFREEGKRIATFGVSPRIKLDETDGFSGWSRMVTRFCVPVVDRMLGLRRLHHHRKKFNTESVEKCYLLKYPKRLRIADIIAILKTFHSIS